MLYLLRMLNLRREIRKILSETFIDIPKEESSSSSKSSYNYSIDDIQINHNGRIHIGSNNAFLKKNLPVIDKTKMNNTTREVWDKSVVNFNVVSKEDFPRYVNLPEDANESDLYFSGGFIVKHKQYNQGLGKATLFKIFKDNPSVKRIFLYTADYQNAMGFWQKMGARELGKEDTICLWVLDRASILHEVRRMIRLILLENNLNDNFKSWFGNSKVSLNGEPRVVYHGTSKKFSKFSLKKTPQPIIWFTTNKDAITSGDVGAAGSGHIMELYISLQNPAGWPEYEKYGLGQLKGLGYDGAILPSPDGNYDGFVFEPSQIKSPQNKGEWNPNNKNIYKESVTKSKVWYHGTDNKFKNFDPQRGKQLGMWFTDDPEFAGMFGENVMSAELDIKNPKVISQDKWDDIRGKHAKDMNFFARWKEQMIAAGHDALFVTRRDTKLGGFDVSDPNIVAVFDTSQIKTTPIEEDNVAFPMQKRVFAENTESFQPKITEVNKYYYHQTSCANAESILKNGFTYPNVGRADYTHGIYFLNFPDANYGPCTIQTIITGNFLDFSNPDDKFGDGWLNFKNSFDANNPEELTKKVRAAYLDLDGIIPMEKMIVVWNTDSLSSIKLHSKK